MNKSVEILFQYLRDVIYNPAKASLHFSELEDDFIMLGKGLLYFAQCFSEYNTFAAALAKGDLSAPPPPPENELAAPLKSLSASLKHLTWQSQQVARGDYSQRVDFMGDFSEAFNTMIEQLAKNRRDLLNEIELGRRKTKALEDSHKLLTNITQQIPQQIVVIDVNSGELLYVNDSAQSEMQEDSGYLDRLMEILHKHEKNDGGHTDEVQYHLGKEERYWSVSSYSLEWYNKSAKAFAITDISAEKNQLKKLEDYAYRDAMTNLHNRFSGMISLNTWLSQKRHFALVFADLDNLKKINDIEGHEEGDMYIITAARALNEISSDTIACRVGGDEFMLMIPNVDDETAHLIMSNVYEKLHGDKLRQNKEYRYSISYGIVTVTEDNDLPASDILSIADERMYENKRMMKKKRNESLER